MWRKLNVVIAMMLMAQAVVVEAGTREITKQKEIFEEGVIRVIGVSAPGQSKYSALQAAEVIAQAKLVGIIDGLSISGNITVKFGKTVDHTITRSIYGFLRNATPCGKKYDSVKGEAEVCMQLDLRGRRGLYGAVYPGILDMISPEERKFPGNGQVRPGETGAEVYDGLVVDVRKFDSFQPALGNRIIASDGSIIFQPSIVDSKLLLDPGPASFASGKEKAEKLLSKTGSKLPLYIEAIDVKQQTDVIIKLDDAKKIIDKDRLSNLLKNARVVYLIN